MNQPDDLKELFERYEITSESDLQVAIKTIQESNFSDDLKKSIIKNFMDGYRMTQKYGNKK